MSKPYEQIKQKCVNWGAMVLLSSTALFWSWTGTLSSLLDSNINVTFHFVCDRFWLGIQIYPLASRSGRRRRHSPASRDPSQTNRETHVYIWNQTKWNHPKRSRLLKPQSEFFIFVFFHICRLCSHTLLNSLILIQRSVTHLESENRSPFLFLL